ncbi:MAG TPA: hypothetical protein VEY51_08865, partial [Chondromyces sp.]|nr:hypothetical protein [Chondromyces sp.]
ENRSKKDTGLTLFKEILEGQLDPFGVKVERGYMYKKKLSFIPDFILTFPDSTQVWAVDYFPSIAQGITTGSYARYLEKRMNTYKEEGFKAFSFVDDSWLALDNDTYKGTLLHAEKQVTRKEKEDFCWDEFLKQEITGETLQFLKEEMGTTTLEIDTRSIAYINVNDRTCKIIRFLESLQNERNITFYELSRPTISLERTLSLNDGKNNFLLYREDEGQLRQEFKNALITRREQAEVDKKEKAEKEAQKLKSQTGQGKVWEDPINMATQDPYKQAPRDVSDLEIELEMEKRAKEAAQRPVDMDPNQWEWYKKTGRVYQRKSNQGLSSTKPDLNQTLQNKAFQEKREAFKEKLLTYPITGEHYINGDSREWRIFLLKWMNKGQKKEGELAVSIKRILNDMKAYGITFNQKEALAEAPIKNFFDFYQKEIKKDLKTKVILIYVD